MHWSGLAGALAELAFAGGLALALAGVAVIWHAALAMPT